MSITFDYASAPFVQCGKIEILTVATLISRMQTRVWWGLAESVFGRSLESGCRFCVYTFVRNLVSIAVKMFSHLIDLVKTFYKCTFSAICEHTAAVNCISY
jgi:hypothetical protein